MSPRILAFLVHVGISVVLALAIYLVVFLFWYPPPLFYGEGVIGAAAVVIGVDLVIGPILTLILFKKGKPGLWIDLTLIAVLQISALVYGAHLLYVERPYYLSFYDGGFHVGTQDRIEASEAGIDLEKTWRFPVVVVVELPDTSEGRLKVATEALQGGAFVPFRPELLQPYAAASDKVLNYANDLSALRARVAERPDAVADIDRFVKKSGLTMDQLKYAPVYAGRHTVVLVLNANDASILGGLNIDPSGG